MSKRRIAIIVAAVCVVGGIVTYALLNPLRRPQDKIRTQLLELTPLGSDEEQVRAALDSAHFQYHPGRKDGDMLWRYRVDYGDRAETAISADLGEYTNLGEFGYIPWHVTVRALWVFDRDGNLFDIQILKYVDSP